MPLISNEQHKHDHGHDHAHAHAEAVEQKNINVTAAYLHVMGDMLMSVGVIIAAVIIYFYPGAHLADPLCTYLFSVIICFTTIPVFKECVLVLMEATPMGLDADEIIDKLSEIDGVTEIHDFHLWSVTMGKYSMSCHIESDNPTKTLRDAVDLCRRKY